MHRAKLKGASVALEERLNAILGRQGLNAQSITTTVTRDFGRGLTSYSVKVVGRASAAGIDGALRWLVANRSAVVLQRMIAQPTQGAAGDKVADVQLDLLVLVATGARG